MKIALVAPGGFDKSGTERVIPTLVDFANRQSKRHEVHVFVLHQYPAPCEFNLGRVRVHNAGYVTGPAATLRTILRTVRAIKQEGSFDLIHAFGGADSGYAAVSAAAAVGIPSIVTLTGGELVRLKDIGYGAQLDWRRRWLVRSSLAKAREVTVATEFMKRMVPRSVRVIRRGPDLEVFKRSDKNDAQIRLIQVASLNRVKDQPTLLRAFKRIRAENGGATLEIVGHDTLGGSIQSMAASMGLGDAVRFTGWMTNQDVAGRLRRASLYVQSSRHESGGIAVLEAGACGVPCVGTAVGHVADLAPDAAAAVPVGDSDALAETAIGLLRDDSARSRMGQQMFEWVRAHDAQWTAGRFDELYHELSGNAS